MAWEEDLNIAMNSPCVLMSRRLLLSDKGRVTTEHLS